MRSHFAGSGLVCGGLASGRLSNRPMVPGDEGTDCARGCWLSNKAWTDRKEEREGFGDGNVRGWLRKERKERMRGGGVGMEDREASFSSMTESEDS